MTDCEFLVAGAGYVGERLLAALPAGRALGLRRDAGDNADIVAADLDAASPSLPAADTIVYTVPPPADGDDDPRLRNFLAALPRQPRRLVYFSTSGVYGDCDGALVDEEAPRRPATARARRRAAAERLLEDRATQHPLELTILRVPGIYGPGRLGLDRLKQGEPVLAEEDAGPGNRIHVDDLVACALAAATGSGLPAIVNVGDGDNRSASWFAAEVARQAGLAAPPSISAREAEATFSRRRLSFLRESRRLDVTRMRRTLGVTPRRPEDGIRDSLR